MSAQAQSAAREAARKIAAQVAAAAGKGLKAAQIFLTARVKETLNVPAPKKRVVSNAGEIFYRATVPATPGAPPRKLSGTMLRSVSGKTEGQTATITVNAKSPRGFDYPRYHEVEGMGAGSGQHKYLEPTIRRYQQAAQVIAGVGLRIRVRV